MKIQCLDHPTSPARTFLIRTNQSTILYNCPLDFKLLNDLRGSRSQRPQQQRRSERRPGDLGSVLSSIAGSNSSGSSNGGGLANSSSSSNNSKLAMELDYAAAQAKVDQRSMFRIANLDLVNVNSIDAVLIANSDMMLGLPYLTEYLGYKGRIYATGPTIEFARQRMEELVAYHGMSGSYVQSGSAIAGIPTAAITGGWRFLYSRNNIQACLEKIQSVGYMQELALFSTVKFVPYSSGYALGAANWVLEVSERNIVLLSSSSIVPNRHPAPLDNMIFSKADVILVSDVRQVDPGNRVDMLRIRDRIKASTAMALQYKRNILFPISTTRTVFDLLEDIRSHLTLMGIPVGTGPGETRFYVVSPVARMSLEYANICGEWMTPIHHDNLYEAMAPLGYSALMKSGALRTIKTLVSSPQEKMEFEEPCVVFTGDHICPGKGPLGTILKQRGNASQIMCIITEPDTPPLADAGNMHVEAMLLDPRTSLADIASLISTYSRPIPPQHIVIPNLPESVNWKSILEDDGRSQVHIYNPGEILTVELNRAWEKVVITEELAANIHLQRLPLSGNAAYAEVTGEIVLFNNRLELRSIRSHYDKDLVQE